MPAQRGTTKRRVAGNHLLYHYLEKDLEESDIWLFQMLAARLLSDLGIWFAPSHYARCPILLPFALRDPDCRPRSPGCPDEWGSPSGQGYFRDDNSHVKGLPRRARLARPTNSSGVPINGRKRST